MWNTSSDSTTTRFVAWDGLATIKLRAWTDNLRYCVLGDLDSSDVSRLQTAAIHNVDDGLVESTALTPLDSEGVDLDDVCEEGLHALMLAFEAAGPVNEWNGPEVVVSLGDSEVFSYRLPLRITSVDDMYRYLNLRGAESNPQFVPVLPSEPMNRPDDETDSRHYVFVHGYNVNATQSREWARAMFKRLWWAGMRSKFTAVDWFGDDSQMYVPTQGDVSPNFDSKDPNRCYTFRIRSRRNEKGELVEAYYGKIYGDFEFEGDDKKGLIGVKFLYYLNPTSLDRNLEWDMKNNLCPNPGELGMRQP